jgi:hypothetical protein
MTHVVRHVSGPFNMERGHPPAAHAKRTVEIFCEEGFDVLCLSECHDYLPHLIKEAQDAGVVLLYKDEKRGDDQNTILVKPEREVGDVWSFEAGSGWFTKSGAKHVPMQPLAAVIDGVLYISGHAPVTAWVVSGKFGRRFVGPVLRRLAYQGFVRRLRRVYRHHTHRPVVAWCDWNATPDTRGLWSPNWLRRKVAGRFIRPAVSTGHGEIDFAVATRVVRVTYVRAWWPKGWKGDHKIVKAMLTLRVPGKKPQK